MNHKLIIYYALLLELITVPFLLFFEPIRIARLGIFYEVFPNATTGAVLMLGAILLACIGLFKKTDGYRFFFFLPQWFFLILTAGSSLYYVSQGHYADGVMRSWEFIFLDQLPSFVAILLYTFAIFDFKKETHVTKIGKTI